MMIDSTLSAFGLSQLPQVILSDLDGTLVDSIPDLAFAVDAMLSDLNYPLAGLEKVRTWVGNGMDNLVRRALSGNLSAEGVDEATFQRAIPLFKQHYQQCNGQHSTLYAGVVETLTHLTQAGYKLGCVTNKPEQFTRPLLEVLDIAQYFELVVGGDTVARRKPDPLPLQYGMQHFQVNAQQTLFLGDSKNDVQAARAAGCPVVCVSYGYNHGENIEDCQPDAIIHALTELLPVLSPVRN